MTWRKHKLTREQMKAKTQNESRTAEDPYADTDLEFAIDPRGTYIIEGFIVISTPGTGDFWSNWTIPPEATISWSTDMSGDSAQDKGTGRDLVDISP